MSSTVSCPLCASHRSYPLPVAGKRYHRCLACELVWLDEADHLDEAAEKAVYDGHDNRVDDPRYRTFLMRAFGEVLSRVYNSCLRPRFWLRSRPCAGGDGA